MKFGKGRTGKTLDSSIKLFVYCGGNQCPGTIIDKFTDLSWFGKAGLRRRGDGLASRTFLGGAGWWSKVRYAVRQSVPSACEERIDGWIVGSAVNDPWRPWRYTVCRWGERWETGQKGERQRV